MEVEGSWVLRPPMSSAPARAVIHFLGGAFLGAAPQLTYRLFLENLAAQGFLVSLTIKHQVPAWQLQIDANEQLP